MPPLRLAAALIGALAVLAGVASGQPMGMLNSRLAFFPPLPPVSGARLSASNSRSLTINGKRIVAPDEMADDVGEYFYPALGTLLVEDELPGKLKTRLEQYRKERDTLTSDLAAQIALAEFEEPAAREKMLRDFATQQTPRLGQLERTAETLRVDLADRADWNEKRVWRANTGKLTPAQEALAEFYVLRAAVYYQKNLSADQRGLLLEKVVELNDRTRSGQRPAPGEARPTFFLPGAARIVLPDPLPPTLEAKAREFERVKFELLKTLHDSILAWEKLSPRKRDREAADLAGAQASQFVALERLAEEIRRDLAALPRAATPRLPPKLPADLASRLAAYREAIEDLQRERLARLRQIMQRAIPRGARGEAGPARGRLQEELSAVRDSVEEFSREHAERMAELKKERTALEAALEDFARLTRDPATGEPMDAKSLIAAHVASDEYFAKIGRAEVMYPHYDVAALWPGLSPEQRRLLFRAAIAALAQPLPGPSFIPGGESAPLPFSR